MPSTVSRAASARHRSHGADPAHMLTDRSLSFIVRHAHRALVAGPSGQADAARRQRRGMGRTPHAVATGRTHSGFPGRSDAGAEIIADAGSERREGFIRRTRREDDSRKRHLFLTEHGRELEAELLPIGVVINRRALAGIDRKDAGLAADLLEKVIVNLEKP
jgi:hypothetical protein